MSDSFYVVQYVNGQFISVISGKVESQTSLLEFYKKVKAYHNAGECTIVVEYLNIV